MAGFMLPDAFSLPQTDTIRSHYAPDALEQITPSSVRWRCWEWCRRGIFGETLAKLHFCVCRYTGYVWKHETWIYYITLDATNIMKSPLCLGVGGMSWERTTYSVQAKGMLGLSYPPHTPATIGSYFIYKQLLSCHTVYRCVFKMYCTGRFFFRKLTVVSPSVYLCVCVCVCVCV